MEHIPHHLNFLPLKCSLQLLRDVITLPHLCLLANWQASFASNNTWPKSPCLEEATPHRLQTKSCGDSHPLHCLCTVPSHLSQETSSRDPSVTMTVKKALFTVLVSRCWLTSFPGCSVCRQPLCPGKWSMHNCLTSQDRYHQLFLFAGLLERG